jgi:hypothetical protein
MEDVENLFHAALDLPLEIRILNPEIKYAAGLMGQTLVRQGAEQVPQMHETGRARRDPCDLGPLGQVPLRVFFLYLFRRRGDVRKEQLGKRRILHNFCVLQSVKFTYAIKIP